MHHTIAPNNQGMHRHHPRHHPPPMQQGILHLAADCHHAPAWQIDCWGAGGGLAEKTCIHWLLNGRNAYKWILCCAHSAQTPTWGAPSRAAAAVDSSAPAWLLLGWGAADLRQHHVPPVAAAAAASSIPVCLSLQASHDWQGWVSMYMAWQGSSSWLAKHDSGRMSMALRMRGCGYTTTLGGCLTAAAAGMGEYGTRLERPPLRQSCRSRT